MLKNNNLPFYFKLSVILLIHTLVTLAHFLYAKLLTN